MTTAPTRPGGGDAVERARRAFVDRFGCEPAVVVSAPGRVNLIGEHTDYQDGFVLPMALRGRTAIALEPVDDVMCEVHAEGFGSETFALTDPPAGTVDWARYVHAVGALLPNRGVAGAAWRGAIATDVPIGASLSSSAALEVAAGRAFAAAAGLDSGDLDPLDLALTGRRVENEVFGVGSGIMDQLVSAIDRPGSAVLIDCRSLDWRPVPLPDDVAVLVLDTGTRRTLVDSAYEERRFDCERAASLLGVAALRDASPDSWMNLDDERLRRRARHVIGENSRVLDAIDALSTGDTVRLGALMDASHASLRDDFEVSSPALDAMVELVRSLPGCLGARMTGGGFAGCCVAVVDRGSAEEVAQQVMERFRCPPEQSAVAPTDVIAA
ncbi:MAG: galactokinase [Ilumatobacteraceae bacterium]